MGLPTEVRSGALSRTYGYDSYGFPTSRKIQKTGVTTFLQNMEYVFDPVKRNLTYRKDINVSQEEKFSYDNLNRLTSYKGLMATYDAKGNILTKGDVSGTFDIIQVASLTPYLPLAWQMVLSLPPHRLLAIPLSSVRTLLRKMVTWPRLPITAISSV